MSGKGFKPKTKIKEIPPELGTMLEPINKTEIKAAAQAAPPTKIGMFEKRAPVVAVPKTLGSAAAAVVAAVKKPSGIPVPVKPFTAAAPAAAAPAPAADALLKKKFIPKRRPDFGFKDPEEFENFKEIEKLIQAEDKGNPYDSPEPPAAYVPETRRAFSEFIKTNYDDFILDAADVARDTPEGEKYPYQRFIREYMRQASPYRGILVYHGLGSGKTCTSIATAEALYSTANKKIIVLAPASLKKNFFNEISLCGFRHFQLRNFWVPMPKESPAVRLFAKTVLNLSDYNIDKAAHIWVPDFRKKPEESNYMRPAGATAGAAGATAPVMLTTDEKTEIREQITNSLVWHPVHNRTGRIRFLSYNGMSNEKLINIACTQPDFFDDAVIIVDEIHNLIRLMQGTIEQYLVKPEIQRPDAVPFQEITASKWVPKKCEAGAYDNAYLYYRLLLQAKGSKIVGLSGTPLINFPEELAILANVLHGYIPVIKGFMRSTAIDAAKRVATAYKYIDFFQFEPKAGGTEMTLTLLPYGIRKLANNAGVERIPIGEEVPDLAELPAELDLVFKTAGIIFDKPLAITMTPLLPPFAKVFNPMFFPTALEESATGPDAVESVKLKNKLVLIKRLTGLISYYKGSRADLMPRIKEDLVVKVPMSNYSQRLYIDARKDEIVKERKPKQAGPSEVFSEIFTVTDKAQTSTYKMSSRQASNFTFPPGFTRPKAKHFRDRVHEAHAGNVEEIIDTVIDDVAEGEELHIPGAEEEAAEEEAVRKGQMAATEAAAVAGAPDAPATAVPQAGGAGEEGEEAEAVEEAVEEEMSTSTLLAPTVLQQMATAAPLKKLLKKKAQAVALTGPTGPALEAPAPAPAPAPPAQPLSSKEEYQKAIADIKARLQGAASEFLTMESLQTYSPKYAEMLKRINAAPGSNLVYSQFVDLEGLNIFKYAMDANGFAPIEFVNKGAGKDYSKNAIWDFSEKTIASFANKDMPRYISFTGAEIPEVRRLSLDIFNGNFNSLPTNIKNLIETAGYTNNNRGEICRVICISSAGAEGLSLKCVRAVHIMEPYWNDVRLRQVKGRAVRINSHKDLPESERDVSVYTYLSVFSRDAQVARSGDDMIDETVRNQDRIDRKEAVKLGLDIAAGASSYVVSTDERLYLISQRKKAITDALESAMKSAAVDCELNILENAEGDTFKCMPLRGKVGDFMYNPDINIDIMESASDTRMGGPGAAPAAAASKVAPAVAALPPGTIKKKLKDTIYIMKETETGFNMYGENDYKLEKLVGTSGKKDGKPTPPVKFL